MNTTDLISQWSMSGAHRDVAGRFRSTDDIRALFGRSEDPEPSPTVSELMVKPADGEEWRPLRVGLSAGAAGAAT